MEHDVNHITAALVSLKLTEELISLFSVLEDAIHVVWSLEKQKLLRCHWRRPSWLEKAGVWLARIGHSVHVTGTDYSWSRMHDDTRQPCFRSIYLNVLSRDSCRYTVCKDLQDLLLEK